MKRGLKLLVLVSELFVALLLASIPARAQHMNKKDSPSPSSRAREVAQHTVITAKTVLIVRLIEDIGLKTAKAGGNFSARVAEPVEVDGVTLIAAGSPVSGSVSKKGEYSPDVTLPFVVVSNKSHKISTGSATINEEVVFPAGSRMKFELVLPLKLDK